MQSAQGFYAGRVFPWLNDRLSADPRSRRGPRQGRLDWLQVRMACGCHLNRPIARMARDHGFRLDEMRQSFVPGMPRTHGWVTVAVAAKAALH